MVSDKVNEYLLLTRKNSPMGLPFVRPAITIADKLTLSIQASEFHYCIPRDNNGPYSHVEVAIVEGGMPKILKPFWEGMPGGVCGYVPVERINYLIRKHGGVKCISRPHRSSSLQAY